jgi:hypothetical protein
MAQRSAGSSTPRVWGGTHPVPVINVPASLSSVSPHPDPEPAGPQPPGRGARRPDPPPPLEANDQLVTASITIAWAVATVVLLIVRDDMPAADRWWVWVPVTGLAMGLFALWYVPHLKRSRARTAQQRAQARASQAADG